MADEEIAPVISVLEYANPKGGSPLNGRLRVEYDNESLIISDPQPVGTSRSLLLGVGVGLIALGGMVSIICVKLAGIDWDHLIPALAAFTCGAIVLVRSLGKKESGPWVHVLDGRLYTKRCPEHDWISGKFTPRRFVASRTETSLSLRGVNSLYSLRVKYRVWITFELMSSLSRDEAAWAVELLNKALHQSDPQ